MTRRVRNSGGVQNLVVVKLRNVRYVDVESCKAVAVFKVDNRSHRGLGRMSPNPSDRFSHGLCQSKRMRVWPCGIVSPKPNRLKVPHNRQSTCFETVRRRVLRWQTTNIVGSDGQRMSVCRFAFILGLRSSARMR